MKAVVALSVALVVHSAFADQGPSSFATPDLVPASASRTTNGEPRRAVDAVHFSW